MPRCISKVCAGLKPARRYKAMAGALSAPTTTCAEVTARRSSSARNASTSARPTCRALHRGSTATANSSPPSAVGPPRPWRRVSRTRGTAVTRRSGAPSDAARPSRRRKARYSRRTATDPAMNPMGEPSASATNRNEPSDRVMRRYRRVRKRGPRLDKKPSAISWACSTATADASAASPARTENGTASDPLAGASPLPRIVAPLPRSAEPGIAPYQPEVYVERRANIDAMTRDWSPGSRRRRPARTAAKLDASSAPTVTLSRTERPGAGTRPRTMAPRPCS